MSKYIKLEDAEDKMYQLWEEDTDNKINSAYCFDDDRAREALSDLPTIEVSEDAISREWLYNELTKLTAVTPTQMDMVSDFADIIKNAPSVVPSSAEGEWIPCSERLPETDNTNEINEFNVLLVVRPKKHPEKTPQIYIGKLRPVKGDDGSGNFWGIKTAPCEWTIWGWSYFQEPEVLAWMPLPQPMKGAAE